jgi:dihydrofolate reductase
MAKSRRIEGYAIVSADGMLANAQGVMPEELKVPGDQRFFADSLNRVDAVVHGRHSHENQPNSVHRRRLILTRQIPALAPDPSNAKALFWNPAGASFDAALHELGVDDGVIAILGGTDVFGRFLDSYDAFHLSHAPDVRVLGGRPVFPQVPGRTPEQVLASHGMKAGKPRLLDPARGATLVTWTRV